MSWKEKLRKLPDGTEILNWSGGHDSGFIDLSLSAEDVESIGLTDKDQEAIVSELERLSDYTSFNDYPEVQGNGFKRGDVIICEGSEQWGEFDYPMEDTERFDLAVPENLQVYIDDYVFPSALNSTTADVAPAYDRYFRFAYADGAIPDADYEVLQEIEQAADQFLRGLDETDRSFDSRQVVRTDGSEEGTGDHLEVRQGYWRYDDKRWEISLDADEDAEDEEIAEDQLAENQS